MFIEGNYQLVIFYYSFYDPTLFKCRDNKFITTLFAVGLFRFLLLLLFSNRRSSTAVDTLEKYLIK